MYVVLICLDLRQVDLTESNIRHTINKVAIFKFQSCNKDILLCTMTCRKALGLVFKIMKIIGLNNILFGNRNTYTKIYIVL